MKKAYFAGGIVGIMISFTFCVATVLASIMLLNIIPVPLLLAFCIAALGSFSIILPILTGIVSLIAISFGIFLLYSSNDTGTELNLKSLVKEEEKSFEDFNCSSSLDGSFGLNLSELGLSYLDDEQTNLKYKLEQAEHELQKIKDREKLVSESLKSKIAENHTLKNMQQVKYSRALSNLVTRLGKEKIEKIKSEFESDANVGNFLSILEECNQIGKTSLRNDDTQYKSFFEGFENYFDTKIELEQKISENKRLQAQVDILSQMYALLNEIYEHSEAQLECEINNHQTPKFANYKKHTQKVETPLRKALLLKENVSPANSSNGSEDMKSTKEHADNTNMDAVHSGYSSKILSELPTGIDFSDDGGDLLPYLPAYVQLDKHNSEKELSKEKTLKAKTTQNNEPVSQLSDRTLSEIPTDYSFSDDGNSLQIK